MEKGDRWSALSKQVLINRNKWCKDHSKATLCEIEDEMKNRMCQLEVQLIEYLVQESASQQLTQTPNNQRPTCPVCYTSLQSRSKRSRTLQGKVDQQTTLARVYGACPTGVTGLFPLDDELGLLPGYLTLKTRDALTHIGSCMPFERAAQMLHTLLSLQVSEPTVRRGIQEVGHRIISGTTNHQCLQTSDTKASRS